MKMVRTKDYKLLSSHNILELVSEKEIFKHYLDKDFLLSDPMISPLRDDDTKPSFIIYRDSYSRLRYQDFGRQWHGDVFDFVKRILKRRYPDETFNHWEVCADINKELKLGLGDEKILDTTRDYERLSDLPIPKPKKILQIDTQPFSEKDLHYWATFGISKQTLKRYKVEAVKELYIDGNLIWTYTEPNPIYSYYYDHSGGLKIYRPKESTANKKWKSGNFSCETLQGYDQLPVRGKLLIITKSLKDVMTLDEMGFTAVAPLSEGTRVSKELIFELKRRFINLVLLFDNDNAGISCASKFCMEYSIPSIFLQEAKDISDLVKGTSLNYAKTTLIKMLNEHCKTKEVRQTELFTTEGENSNDNSVATSESTAAS